MPNTDDFDAADHHWMAQALQLAAHGQTTATPNPAVGCVIVSGDECVGSGWHERAGQPHAEALALAAAGTKARGATAYVTLEPCTVAGRTPPCASALVEAGIARVVYATRDPNPAVDGAGDDLLTRHGVQVQAGLMQANAEQLNEGFAMRMRHGRPFVTVKIAGSLDGASAMRSGESQWITGTAARQDVQRLRARACAVLTGIGTVLADDPSLNVRDGFEPATGRQPLRVVLDRSLRTPADAKLLQLPGQVLILSADSQPGDPSDRIPNALHCQVAESDVGLDLAAVVRELARREINELLVEAGATLCGALAAAGLIDRFVFYLAPTLLGSQTRRLLDTPGWLALADGMSLHTEDVTQVGPDLRIRAKPLRRLN
ncbi:MAG: bifunctional diaminohydroxyphosphoribosylaminopyrimidine deaminase/5-amino-6-(5-phosphoribosylamino)uracil reductase RibD [Pseudomonadota bacterium]